MLKCDSFRLTVKYEATCRTLVHVKTAPSKNAFQNMGAYRFQEMITNKKVSLQILLKNDVELKYY